jgi:hypothetical protein
MQRSKSFIASMIALLAMASGSAFTVRAATMSNHLAQGIISIDNSRADWAGIASFPADGNEGYPIDLSAITLANDNTNLYVRYQMNSNGPFLSPAFHLLLDTDQNLSTGYNGQNNVYQNALGAEKFIEGRNVFDFTGGSNQGAFSFSKSVPNDTSYNDTPSTDIELRISLASLGNPGQFNFLVWMDSNADFGISHESAGGDEHFPNGVFNGTTANIDTYIVPEPSCLAAIGIGGLFLLRRKRCG